MGQHRPHPAGQYRPHGQADEREPPVPGVLHLSGGDRPDPAGDEGTGGQLFAAVEAEVVEWRL